MRKNNTSSILIIIFISFLFSITPVYANVVDPEFLKKHCKSEEKQIICNLSILPIAIWIKKDECKEYRNNPNYYYVYGGRISIFYGIVRSEIYCKKANTHIDTPQRFKILYLEGGAVLFSVIISLIALFTIRKKYVNN